MIFLELVPHSAMFVLLKKCSEMSGSFFLYSNDLRIAVNYRVVMYRNVGVTKQNIATKIHEL